MSNAEFPPELPLSEVIERGYLYDCKVSRLKSNPALKLNRMIEEDGKGVPYYSDIYLDL